MKTRTWISLLFIVAAVYDAVLGLLFIAAPGYAFDMYSVTPPNHMGYVQFPAALLLIFALMFVSVARDPVGNRQLIVYGVLLKLAYCAITSWYWVTTDIPGIWKPFVPIDFVMGVLFVWAYVLLARSDDHEHVC